MKFFQMVSVSLLIISLYSKYCNVYLAGVVNVAQI